MSARKLRANAQEERYLSLILGYSSSKSQWGRSCLSSQSSHLITGAMKDESLFSCARWLPWLTVLFCYLAWWSLDYLREKLDLTGKRNHISSFYTFCFAFNSLVRLLLYISLIS